ncbi:MAG TPA: aldehyde dehydrogenase family protein [Terriglobia bacterium]|nr:aldehyde dehydrogenase family protein [Terriglobia bacterium]
MATATPVSEATICPNYVGGKWVESRSARKVERRNPANLRDLIGYTPVSTREEMREAIAAAERAYPGWRDTPAPKRGKILLQAARLLEERKDEVARLLTREEGKTVAESLGELTRTINIVEYISGEARRLGGETLPSELPKNFAYTIRQPLGVVGLITPWNFPVAVPVWKIAPALVCGNTVVWKPAGLTPFVSRRVVEIFAAAGVPAGVLNLVQGSGAEVGDELVEHPAVRAISFTGSNEVGQGINAKAARQLKKVQLEMGGKNPVVVLEDADLELAADNIISGAFGSTGQRCTATSRLVVVESVADALVGLLVERARKLKVGDGAEPDTFVGPSVDASQCEKVEEYLEIGKSEARLSFGGERLHGGSYDHGYFIAPTIFDHVPVTARLAQEEIFGPVLSVTRVKDFEEAIDAANNVRYGLTASVFTRDANRVFQAADRLEVGMVHVNSPTVGGEAHVPFGGIKATGFGEREVGSTAIDFYSELKVVYVDYTGRKREGKLY